MVMFFTLGSKDLHVLRRPQETASFKRRLGYLDLRPGSSGRPLAGRHWGRWAQQGQSLPERGPVLSLEAHPPAFLSLWVRGTLGWIAPLGFISLCVLGLLAASPSLALPGPGRMPHTFQTHPVWDLLLRCLSPHPFASLSFPLFLYLENLLAKVPEVLAFRMPPWPSLHDHQPELLPGAEF